MCGGAIAIPAGARRGTVTCPACQTTTSVAAVSHRCGSCGTLLESPAAQEGLETTCPRCGSRRQVPRDVLRTEAPALEDDAWFGCTCTACKGPLVANKEDVGALAACPRCAAAIRVPNWGHYLHVPPTPPTSDPLDSLYQSTSTRCPSCKEWAPTRGEHCPYCGVPLD
jgi:DNA-directed RNA polymerase subunit RPC12/RpoP